MAEQLADVFDVQIQFPIDLRSVKSDLNARNAIGTYQRYEGLEVYVISDAKKYRLEGGISNSDWVDVTGTTDAGLQAVTVSTSNPAGGKAGDIHFKNTSSGTEVWYNNDGTWGAIGTIAGGGVTATLNNSLDPFGTTSANLDSAYPNAKVGDIVYTETGQTKWEKLATGKWTRTSLDIV